MKLKFHNKRISGLLVVLPKNEVRFEDEMANYNFPSAKSLKLKTAMGYDTRRVVNEGTCTSDLCIYGLNYLFEKGLLQKDEIDVLLLITQTPDYIMPPTSNVIQGKLGLKQDMICMDVNQGCAGYIIGLIQAFGLLEQESINKVVLINADVISRKVSKRDRNSNPLIGDGAAITVVEKGAGSEPIVGTVKMDGRGAEALMIPAGGMRLPSNAATAEMLEDANGNFRSKDNLVMKGDEVFNFVQTEVPPMIDELLQQARLSEQEVDYFMFHQPNRFMLQKLADKMNVAHSKMPNDIVGKYGNSSGVSVPLAMAHTLGNRLQNESFTLCLAGFGVGLTWASLLVRTQPFEFCEMIDYE